MKLPLISYQGDTIQLLGGGGGGGAGVFELNKIFISGPLHIYLQHVLQTIIYYLRIFISKIGYPVFLSHRQILTEVVCIVMSWGGSHGATDPDIRHVIDQDGHFCMHTN